MKTVLTLLTAAAIAITTVDAEEYYELRSYQFNGDEAAGLFDAAMKNAGLAALQEAGASKVGVFQRKPGDGENTSSERYLLVAYPTIEALAKRLGSRAESTSKHEAVLKYLSSPKKDPAFSRIDSTLMVSFGEFPALVDPEGDGGTERYFELRTYESHNELKARLKIEMFNQGGECEIFRETGLKGVFFGDAVIGTDLPKLVYMLVHENDAAKDKAWNAFREAPAWKKLSGDERYADTVSKIDKRFLVAMPYSPLR